MPADATGNQNNPDEFRDGKNAASEGRYHEAAEIWISYAESLSSPEYRVGHELILLVTRHRLTEHYERTSDIYLNGLEDPNITDEEQQLLLNDLYYIRSMLDRGEERALESLIERKDRSVYRFFHNFWRNKSLTPSDPYNERLMEHWERVNFALENFATVARSPYDDRGDIYIRFGEPQRKRDGIFMYNPGFANYLVATRMDDGRGYGSAIDNAVNTTTYLNTLYRVVDYHQYPSFEVWVYYGLSNTPDNSVFLFGNLYGGEQMTFKQSVDDFIPSAAYSSTRRNNPVSMNIIQEDESGQSSTSSTDGGDDTETDVVLESAETGVGAPEPITPALILQIMYYRQLASLDPFFSGRYEEMLNRYENTSMPLSASLARQFQQQNAANTIITKRGMPEEKSSAGNAIYELDTNVFAYRFADENLDPVLRLYTEEDFEQVIEFEELKKRNNMSDIRYDDYRTVRTIRLLDESGEPIFEDRVSSQIDSTGMQPQTEETVQIPYEIGSTSLEMITELYDDSVGDSSGILENSTVRKNLKGVGRSEMPVENYDRREGFFISDVIIGYVSGEEETFSIAHDRIIPEDSILRIYYESYNLPRDESGLYTFSLTYNLKRDRSLMGRIIRFGRVGESTMTVDNTTDSSRFEQYLEIVSDQLSSGSYTLDLTFSQPESGEELYSVTLPVTVE
jgi:GWxTD domain-containing protein